MVSRHQSQGLECQGCGNQGLELKASTLGQTATAVLSLVQYIKSEVWKKK